MSAGLQDSSSRPLSSSRIFGPQRACDSCRKKKSRCDGVEESGLPCANCSKFRLDCTYKDPAKRRGRPRSYVESLEHRIKQLEKIIQRLCPDEKVYRDILQALDSSIQRPARGEALPTSGTLSSSFVSDNNNPAAGSVAGVGSHTDVADESDPEDDINAILTERIRSMHLEPPEYRFLGKSSGLTLIRTTRDLKNAHATPVQPPAAVPGAGSSEPPLRSTMKHKHLTPLPWELKTPYLHAPSHLSLPAPDLALSLIELFFRNPNLHIPVLHRPTFMKLVAERRFLAQEGDTSRLSSADDPFTLVYLLVCAIGARYSDDPRCLLDDVPVTAPHALQSSGWKWFHQAQALATRRNIITPPTLYDIQFYILSAEFLVGSSAPSAAWTLIGFGVRVAQDVGAHRKRTNARGPGSEEEMLKRAFWALVCMDGIVSASLGRACAIPEEDFHLDLPIDCDDEYWDVDNPDPEKRFQQPADKPSKIASFIMMIKLNAIMALALRTIYPTNKDSPLQGILGGTILYQNIIAELDSRLNNFADSIPTHLKWDPSNTSDVFFTQSASLYALYYNLQILVHRPFIPTPSKPSPVLMPSLTICTNAARSCCRLVNVVRHRDITIAADVQIAAFTSAMVLLLNIWGSKSSLSTLPSGMQRDMEDVYGCMQVLKESESRWHVMGRLWDILCELASARDLMSTMATSSTCDLSQSVPLDSFPVAPSGHPDNFGDLSLLQHLQSSLPSQSISINWELQTSTLFQSAAYQQSGPSADAAALYGTSLHNFQSPAEGSQQPAVSPGLGHDAMFHSQPQDDGQYNLSQLPGSMDNNLNMMSMWFNPPYGFRLDDWDAYLSRFGDLAHHAHNVQGPSQADSGPF